MEQYLYVLFQSKELEINLLKQTLQRLRNKLIKTNIKDYKKNKQHFLESTLFRNILFIANGLGLIDLATGL